MKKFLVIVFVFSMILTACLELDDGTYKSFYAQNLKNNSYYKLDAELLAEGVYCNVWAERGSGVSAETAQKAAKTYDNEIYIKMINTFGITYEGYNTMQLADALTDNDGKLCILLLDIKDSYSSTNSSYVAGYFQPSNFLSKDTNANSNECDMIYIDINPGVPGSVESNSTFAHEMQHLMNFVTSLVVRGVQYDNVSTEILMDTWVDEGLSSAAEWLYLGKHVEDRIDWYNNSEKGKIKEGNNFFVWGNHDAMANLDDYATVYMFFQWLRLQSGGTTGIYKNIISSRYNDYRSVSTALNALAAENYSGWDTVLKTWLAANVIKANTGQYGYRGEPAFAELTARNLPDQRSINLAPGEGVYSKISGVVSTAPNSHIRYAHITAGNTTVQDYSNGNSGTLLTYNVNTDNTAGTETGTTTGAAADIAIDNSGARQAAPSGPYRISANDMLRKNGFKENTPVLKIPEIFRIRTDD